MTGEAGSRPGPSAQAGGPGAVPGWHRITLDAVGSTNDEAKRLAGEGAPDRTLVTARRQEGGRGRRGRVWSSPEGNLYVSFVLRHGRTPSVAAQLSFVAAVALAEALCALLPDGVAVRCKWPNDILLDGAKVAGMLLETEGEGGWLVVGIGVNIRHEPERPLYPATSLLAKSAAGIGPEEVLAHFLPAFDRWYGRWSAQGFAPVRAGWLAAAHGVGGPVTVRLETSSMEGRFVDLDADGALLLERSDGTVTRVTAGDVHFGGQSGRA
jgi:BirA family transcriptional regulator, biotin operon repressor / biotin---[acetyl-CoA-carboxylase] ligase